MGDFGGMHRPGIVVDYHNKPSPAAVAARGIKRKMMPQPYNKPGGTFIKKPKMTKPILKLTQKKSSSKWWSASIKLKLLLIHYQLFTFNIQKEVCMCYFVTVVTIERLSAVY